MKTFMSKWIAGLFDQQYLQKDIINLLDFLHSNQ